MSARMVLNTSWPVARPMCSAIASMPRMKCTEDSGVWSCGTNLPRSASAVAEIPAACRRAIRTMIWHEDEHCAWPKHHADQVQLVRAASRRTRCCCAPAPTHSGSPCGDHHRAPVGGEIACSPAGSTRRCRKYRNTCLGRVGSASNGHSCAPPTSGAGADRVRHRLQRPGHNRCRCHEQAVACASAATGGCCRVARTGLEARPDAAGRAGL